MIQSPEEAGCALIEGILLNRTPVEAAEEMHRCGISLSEFHDYAAHRLGILSSVRHQVANWLLGLELDDKRIRR